MSRGLLAAASVAVALAGGALYTGPVFRAALVADRGWSSSLVAGAFAVGYVAAGLTPVLGGIAADRLGARRVLLIGLLLASVGLLGASLTRVPWHWYISAGLALGVAYYLVNIAATLTATRGAARGRAVGIALGLGGGVGVGVGPVLAQLAVDTVGWRVAMGLFGVMVLVGAISIALATRSRRLQAAAPSADRERAPTVLSEPETDLAMPSHGRWRLIVGFFIGNALMGVFDETIYQHGLGHAVAVGLSGRDAATLIGVVSIGMTVGMLFGGPLSDTVGRQTVLVGAALVTALALLGFADASAVMIWGWGTAYGIGLGASIAVRSAAWGDAFQGPGRGRAFGMVASGYPVGAALTIWLGAVWLDGGGSFEVLALVAALAAVLWAIVGGTLTAPAGVAPGLEADASYFLANRAPPMPTPQRVAALR
jgi:MFS family permease